MAGSVNSSLFFDNAMRKHKFVILSKRPVPVPQFSLLPKIEWRFVSLSLKLGITLLVLVNVSSDIFFNSLLK